MKKNFAIFLVSIYVSFFLFFLGACNAQEKSILGDFVHDQKESLRIALQALDSSKSSKYVAAFQDINGDGNLEAIVYLIGGKWCGSAGCTTLVLAPKGTSWRVVSKITITRLPIRLMTETSHGWHSLGVWVQGGGIQPGYEAKLCFDGRTYPQNPSLPSVVRLKSPAGEILISSMRDAKPLY